jgi:hypothetical protein
MVLYYTGLDNDVEIQLKAILEQQLLGLLNQIEEEDDDGHDE